MKPCTLILSLLTSLSAATTAFGYTPFDTSFHDKKAVTQGTLALAKTSYSFDQYQVDFDLERTGLLVQHDIHLGKELAAFGALGYTLDAESGPGDGNGFSFGGGAKKRFLKKEKLSLVGYGWLNYTSDTLKSEGQTTDFTNIEIHAGPTVSFAADQMFSLEGSLDLALYGNGDAKTTSGGSSDSTDYEQDGRLTLRVGVATQQDDWFFRVMIAIANENSLYLSFGQSH